MFEFIGNTLKIMLVFIFIAIPLGIIATWLLLKYLVFCASIAGFIGVFLGFLLLVAMGFASLISY